MARRLYLHPQMIDWFNEWQSHPTQMGITDRAVAIALRPHYAIRNVNETEEKWLYFFTSFLQEYSVTDEYRRWIRDKLGSEPHLGVNSIMTDEILTNFRHPDKPFNTEGYSWHDKIMFVRRDSPPTYPHIGLQKIGIINWMWNSPFTLK